MKLVIDTNVLVSGVLSADSPPSRILDAVRSGHIRPVTAASILAEYSDVLRRPRLRLDRAEVDELLTTLSDVGLQVVPAPVDAVGFPDQDDLPFYGAALAARCPLVTGNQRHFPDKGPVRVLSPRQLLDQLGLD
jgi:putative PIN family toxin of toxin-antitoxin system